MDRNRGSFSSSNQGTGVVNLITGKISDPSKLSNLPQADPTLIQGLNNVMHFRTQGGRQFNRLEEWESEQAYQQAQQDPTYSGDVTQKLKSALGSIQTEQVDLIP